MDLTNLNKLKALALAASSGPWDENVWCGEHHNDWAATGPRHTQDNDEEELCPDTGAGKQAEKDAAYIAAASPDVILSMIEEIEAYRECLRFYAQETKYNLERGEHCLNPSDSKIRHALSKQADDGLFAREVLKKFGGRDDQSLR